MKVNACDHCDNEIMHVEVIKKSLKNHGVKLCLPCQRFYQRALLKSAHCANVLFFALKRHGVNALLSYEDGHKTIDIAVKTARLYIEVDGDQHNKDSAQAFADLMRTFYSLQQGYFTLRIPNSLTKKKLHETIKFIRFIIHLLENGISVVQKKRA